MNGKNIVKYREDNYISQDELANKIGISRATLSRWENNRTAPRGDEYNRLRDIIGDEYLVEVDLREKKTTNESIVEISERINNILYEVTKIENKQESVESINLKEERRHRRIRTVVVITVMILIFGV